MASRLVRLVRPVAGARTYSFPSRTSLEVMVTNLRQELTKVKEERDRLFNIKLMVEREVYHLDPKHPDDFRCRINRIKTWLEPNKK